MKTILKMLLIAHLIVLTSSLSVVAATNLWEETCTSCGKTTTRYAHSFDEQDYEVFSRLLRTLPGRDIDLLARAPHGPTPACDSQYETNSLSFLQKKMPKLKPETYQSFITRNDRIAAHCIKKFKNADGGTVRIIQSRKKTRSAARYARIGTDKDKTQILVFNGQVFFLYKKEGDFLVEIGRCVMWIS